MNAIVENISLVKQYKDTKNPDLEIEFSPEDATGNALTRKEDGKRYLDFQSEDFEYLIEVVRRAIEAGANIINTPDTL
jgi:isopropylmalate/homocitrate/citramalate synthase